MIPTQNEGVRRRREDAAERKSLTRNEERVKPRARTPQTTIIVFVLLRQSYVSKIFGVNFQFVSFGAFDFDLVAEVHANDRRALHRRKAPRGCSNEIWSFCWRDKSHDRDREVSVRGRNISVLGRGIGCVGRRGTWRNLRTEFFIGVSVAPSAVHKRSPEERMW